MGILTPISNPNVCIHSPFKPEKVGFETVKRPFPLHHPSPSFIVATSLTQKKCSNQKAKDWSPQNKPPAQSSWLINVCAAWRRSTLFSLKQRKKLTARCWTSWVVTGVASMSSQRLPLFQICCGRRASWHCALSMAFATDAHGSTGLGHWENTSPQPFENT